MFCLKADTTIKDRASLVPAFVAVVVVLGCLAGSAASGATYYLDPVSGNDTTGDGSSSSPWKTMQHAEDNAVNGSTVYLRTGNYGEVELDRTDINRTGWDQGIIWKADSGARPTFEYLYVNGGGRYGDGCEDYYYTFENLTVIRPDDGTNTWASMIRKASYVKFIGCTFIGQHKDPYESGCTEILLRIDDTRSGDPDGVKHILIENCELRDGKWGINIAGEIEDDIVIRGCTLHHLAGSAIMTDARKKCKSYIIEDCRIYDQDTVYQQGAGENTHGSGITVHEPNMTIRRNIIHNFGGSGTLTLYDDAPPADGYHDMLIENNLFYDNKSGAPVKLYELSDNVVFRNNTVIGYHTGSNNKTEKYGSALSIKAKEGWDYSGVSIYNNVIVGKFNFGSDDGVPSGDNNFFWSVWDGDQGNFVRYGSDGRLNQTNSVIIAYSYSGVNIGYSLDYFEGSNNFFVGGADFDTYSCERPGGEPHGINLDDCYKLAPGSPADGAADSANCPSTDLLSATRSSSPDAGCYEYSNGSVDNSAPVLGSIGSKTVDENSLLTFTVTAADADGDTIIYSASNLPSGASFSNRTFSWMPGYEQAGSYQVTFTASDGVAQDSETVTITVNNVNRAPVLSSIGNKIVSENNTLQFTITASDADGDNIIYSISGLPGGAAFGNQTFSWTPGYNQSGTYQVSFTVSDGVAQDSETITITVSNVNRAPQLDSIGSKSVYANDTLSFSLDASDADGDSLSYSASSLPSGATFASQTFSWTPSIGQAGNYQVTFSVGDGQAQDSEAVGIVVYSVDNTAPAVTGLSPSAGSVQVALNSLIILHITDSGKGVDGSSVSITVNGDTIYTGDVSQYDSSGGLCRRTGTSADYTYTYQADAMFAFNRKITVTVNATDLAGNAMSAYTYNFRMEMRSFGKNKKASSVSNSLNKSGAQTVTDSSGNVYTVWQSGEQGSRDIYLSSLENGAEAFGTSIQLANNSADQCNPSVAIDDSDKLYVVWQDNRSGNWDIYSSTSVDGVNFSSARLVVDSNDNQTNPVVVVESSSSGNAWVVWQDDRAGNQDIYAASSGNDFLSKTVHQVTSNSSNQTEPAAAVDAGNTVYVLWTDTRSGTSDIYGASSDGSWDNVAVVSKAYSQSRPAIAAESTGSVLHFLWEDDSGGNKDIYYASSNFLPTSPLGGSSIIDDSSGAEQLQPTIEAYGSTGSGLKVFASWQDSRNVTASSTDTDLYFTEVTSDFRTNIFVGDDSTNSDQTAPAIGVDLYGNPYVVWTDSRNSNTDIYYAHSTFIESQPIESSNVSFASGATVGTPPASVNSAEDVSVTIPAAAYNCDLNVTISRVKNQPKLSVRCFSIPYEFGPSGIDFDKPVTITIPYEVSSSASGTSAYWYNPLTGGLSQQGITDVETVVISSDIHALRFRTTHFTQFFVGSASTAATGGGGGGGGGCSLSQDYDGSITEFMLPYIVLAILMGVLKVRDRRKRRRLCKI